MKIFFPAYYKRFQCIASDCPDSCCKEWTVDVDAESARYYRALPGPLGDRLRQVLAEEDGSTVMTIEEGRCPMWRQDGLCQIQSELGHDALCKTCREYPRLRHDYDLFAELGLELSCPEAARLILTSPVQTLQAEEEVGLEEAQYDPETMDILRKSRETVISLLAEDSFGVPEALAVILMYSHSVQAVIDGGPEETFDARRLLNEAMSYAGAGDGEALRAFFRGLEILTPQWRDLLEQPLCAAPWQPQLRQMAAYLIQRYWLQAISDYDIVCRAKLVIASCLLVHLLGGPVAQTAQLFSKEIENAAENVDAILDSAYCEPALTDVNLLSLLLE